MALTIAAPQQQPSQSHHYITTTPKVNITSTATPALTRAEVGCQRGAQPCLHLGQRLDHRGLELRRQPVAQDGLHKQPDDAHVHVAAKRLRTHVCTHAEVQQRVET